MYISNEDICVILYFVYMCWALVLPFLQTMNLCTIDLIIITCFAIFASAPYNNWIHNINIDNNI